MEAVLDFSGRRVLVTGGTAGIGRGIAEAFLERGADVVVCGRTEPEALPASGAREAVFRRCDVRRAEQCHALVEGIARDLGGLDVLVNNAAFQNPVDKVEDVSYEQFQRTFATNIEATFFVTQAALPHMKEGSAVINTASITGLQGHATLLDYSATKGAIITLTYSLAQALVDRKIRVNAVAPGPVWTPLIPATMDEESVKGFGTDTPMGRAAQPDEIAPSYVFFASNRLSSYYSGEVLAPVGGQTMPG